MKYLLILLVFQFFSCENASQTANVAEEKAIQISKKDTIPPAPILKFEPFERTASLTKMKAKIAENEPLIVHVFVPLCDNDNQGIVPVNARLGDGLNLKSNLYWGAMYGVKSYFKRLPDWQLLHSENDPNTNVLERVVFFKNYGKGKKIYLVADAYRGDRMKECLTDYFKSLSGEKTDAVTVKNEEIAIANQADLLVFNGHNGLMDTSVESFGNKDGIIKDAAVIACASGDYFEEPLNFLNAYPVLTTTNLLAPEAYVLEAVVENWAVLNDGDSFKIAAGKAYHRFQKCGVKGATRLFKSGW